MAASAAKALKYLTVAARTKHTATVIFVHGLGDSGYGWEPVAQMFGRDPALNHVKWVLPHAPSKNVTANYGARMPAWFDVTSFGDFNVEDETGMLKTSHSLNQLITSEVDNGIPANRIILGGFSQGGAMSLLTGLTTERKLAGVVTLSAWLPLRQKIKMMASDHAKRLPIFWGHGTIDPIVPFRWAETSVDYLKKNLDILEASAPAPPAQPTGLTFKSYENMEHSTCQEELDDFSTWLANVIPEVAVNL